MKQLFSPILRLRIGDFAPAVGAYLAVAASSAPGWAPAASETAYLAWLTGCILLAVAAVDRRPALPAALLVVTAAWVLPPGASRGLAVTALLALALAAAAWLGRSELTRVRLALPLALGLQILLRSEDLLTGTPAGIAADLFPALLAAAALAWLPDREGRDLFLAVAAASIVIVGSSDSGLAITLLIFAVSRWLSDRHASKPEWIAILLGFALLVAWNPHAALLASAAAAIAVAKSWMRWTALAAVSLGAIGFAASSWAEALALLPWLPIVLPAAFLTRRPWPTYLAGLVLALAGARILPPESTPAAALLLLAWRRDSPAWSVQKPWSAILLGGTVLMASYPWLRWDPALDTLARLGLVPSIWAALLLVALAALAGYARRLDPRASSLASGLVVVAAAVAILVHLPRPTVSLIGYDPANIGPHRAHRTFETSPTPTRSISVGASASNSTALPSGTTVATVTAFGEHGRSQSWHLRAGEHVSEWAVRRADLRDRPELGRPRPWVAWSVPGFFGSSFRSLHRLDEEIVVTAIRIERSAEIAPEVGLRIDHLDLRP